MQYKLSICNNETLMKGLKAKLNAFEEKNEKNILSKVSKGKENQPVNKVKHIKVDLYPK
jgi:hypothetical protein